MYSLVLQKCFKNYHLIDCVPMKHASFDLLQRRQRVKGLSYVEVMVSMITSAIFLSTTLQAYVAATGIRAKSQQINTAIAKVQADAESLRQMAQALPQTAADCQLSSSSSYAQQMMAAVVAKDTATYRMSPQTQSPQAIIRAIKQRARQPVLKQSSTLPISGLPDDYKLRRVLSVDQSVPPSAQVLQVSYTVLRRYATKAQPSKEDDRSPSFRLQSETPLAQLHTSILPNAALVCF
jgi:Tfp pilus assembly protein PilE